MIEKPMMLVNSVYMSTLPTFALMPVTSDCPYIEAVFDPSNKVLIVISKEKKDTFHMLERLDTAGFPIKNRVRKGSEYEEVVQQERKLVTEHYHYTLYTQPEIEAFVSRFAYNSDTFDYKQFFNISDLMKGTVEVPVGPIQAEA